MDIRNFFGKPKVVQLKNEKEVIKIAEDKLRSPIPIVKLSTKANDNEIESGKMNEEILTRRLSAKKSQKSATIDLDFDELIDSDDDKHKELVPTVGKRLQKTKKFPAKTAFKESATEPSITDVSLKKRQINSSEPKPIKNDSTDQEYFQSNDGDDESGVEYIGNFKKTKPSMSKDVYPPVQFSSNESQISTSSLKRLIEPNISTASASMEQKKRKEITGGVSSFFGSSTTGTATTNATTMTIPISIPTLQTEETNTVTTVNIDADITIPIPITITNTVGDNDDNDDVIIISSSSVSSSPPPNKKTAVTRVTETAVKPQQQLRPSTVITSPQSEDTKKQAPRQQPAPTAVGGVGAGGYSQYRRASAGGSNQAIAAGSRAKPKGNATCLNGLKFVITGVMTAFSREDIEDLVLSHDGKISTAVSGRTDYLIAGQLLEDGRNVEESSKYRTAIDKKVKIITEDEFLKIIEDSVTDVIEPVSSSTVRGTVSSTVRGAVSGTVSNVKPYNQPFQGSSSSSSSSSSSYSSFKTPMPTVPVGEDDRMWVDKYKPAGITEIIGCQDTVKKLCDWLTKWDSVHIQGTLKIPFSKDNPGAKAVLLSGPPGIGKTTMATLIGKHYKYEILELNASDTRNAKSITQTLAGVLQSQSITTCASNSHAHGLSNKRLVIMDECDGMGGSDRGGIQELIKILKTSKNPIICICNDRMCTKVRSLANHCYDLRVRRPTKAQIASRMVQVAAKEGLAVDSNAAEMLVEQTGNDIRQVIHSMQMWRSGSTRLSYSELKDNLTRIEKDKVLRQSPFDACSGILGGGKTSFNDRYNSFFIDYSLIPLLVQQNYIDSSKGGIFKNPLVNEAVKMDQLSMAADSVSDMDIVGSKIMGINQHWELLPTQAMFAVRTGAIIQGFQAFPAFPMWLGKNSTHRKMQRLTQELVLHTSLYIQQGFTPMRLEYVPYLRSKLLKTLVQDNETGGGVEEAINMLDAYGLNRDDFMETFKEMQFVLEKDAVLRDNYDVVDTKSKTAFTRLYNSGEHRSQALVSAAGVDVKKKKATKLADADDDDLEGLGLDEGEDNNKEDSNDEDDNDVSMFVKKSKGSKLTASNKASAASTTAAKGGKKSAAISKKATKK